MKFTRYNALGALALGALALGACAEPLDDTPTPDAAQQRQAIIVQPQFSIEGVERLDDALLLEELGLSISEIRLEPLDGNDDLAYSFIRPQYLRFDVASGVRTLCAQPLELPAAGRYLVSIRVEPVYMRSEDGVSRTSSFTMSGHVAYDSSQAAKGGTMSEGPIPRPFRDDTTRPKDDAEPQEHKHGCRFKRCPTVTWAPFSYHSERSVFYTIDEVHIIDGSQHLSFSFDVEAWGAEAVESISRAVSSPDAAPILDDRRGLDITRQLDSMGQGVDALVERTFVKANPQAL
jgi:hypothetical protein